MCCCCFFFFFFIVQVQPGNKRNAVSASLSMASPMSPRDLDMTFKAETPFKGYRDIEAALNHKINNDLNSKVR